MADRGSERKVLLDEDPLPFSSFEGAVAVAARTTGALEPSRTLLSRWVTNPGLAALLLVGALAGMALFSATSRVGGTDDGAVIPVGGSDEQREGGLVDAVGDIVRAGNSRTDDDREQQLAGPSAQDSPDPTSGNFAVDDDRTTTTTTATLPRPGTSPTTSKATSTEAPTTAVSVATTTTSSVATSSTTTAVIGDATVSGRISFASTGTGAKGLTVKLRADTDRDGSGDAVVRNASTGSQGRFSWSIDPGCYVVEFLTPTPQSIVDGFPLWPLCVGSGERRVDINAAITDPPFVNPSSCEVQIGRSTFAGVEIWNSNARWAPSYQFLNASGTVLFSTTQFGPPDDLEPDEPSIEWTSAVNGFEESQVFAVAAEHSQGLASDPVTCRRVSD